MEEVGWSIYLSLGKGSHGLPVAIFYTKTDNRRKELVNFLEGLGLPPGKYFCKSDLLRSYLITIKPKA